MLNEKRLNIIRVLESVIPMDAKKLDVLIKAINEGSFSKATTLVGYTQSGLTHLVNSLEKEVGFSLVNRSFNGIKLSKEGEELLPYILNYIQSNDELLDKIDKIKHQQKHTIKIAAYASMAMRWLPEILYRFKRECPEVDVDLRMVDNAIEPFELLVDGKCDIIFASRQNFENIDWIDLYNEKMYAIVPDTYQEEDYFDVEKFKDSQFLMPYGRFDIDVYRILNGIKINEIRNQVDDETLIRMVSKGLGITMMSELMIRGSLSGVKCLEIKPQAIRKLGMGKRKTNHNSYLYKLKDCVISYLKDEHYGLI